MKQDLDKNIKAAIIGLWRQGASEVEISDNLYCKIDFVINITSKIKR
jgi:hypothetical protein